MECENKDCVRVRMQRDSLHTHFWNSNLSMKCKDATIARLRAENKRLRARSKVLAGACRCGDSGDSVQQHVENSAKYASPFDIKVWIEAADAEVRKIGRKRK